MGIPLYFKIISDKYTDIIVADMPSTSPNSYLFLDLNCAIHPCCRNFLKTIENYNPKFKND